MAVFICQMCGHIEFGEAPENCPVCGSSKFSQNDAVFTESKEKSPEAETKHAPAISVIKECGLIPDMGCVDIMVRIGETLHPMEEKHHIAFIDCYVDETYVGRQMLSPGLYPAGCFHLKADGQKVTIVENCTVHGYWKAEASLS